ncbi:DUF4214 domain-containing protein [Rhodovarius crocodyli]|uniref:DUF4214 domain-containing protein n=1 Tax=Rhodovarius crocodyli TaxID=1979269 RepID=UPI0013E39371|nr:DUF4214 domain-containing protein [Rhodovarius crocodyli]
MAAITAAELIVGTDHDFVVNLYLALLDRWPDEAGYEHFMERVRDKPEERPGAIHYMAQSPEALSRGRHMPMPDPLVPGDPQRALAAQMDLRSSFLFARMNELKDRPKSEAADPAIAPLVRELRAEMAALRREMREELAAIAGRLTQPPAAEAAVPAAAAREEWADLLSLAEARMEMRLRALERRLP